MSKRRLSNYIPDIYRKSIFDVDYDKLYDDGYRLMLIDLDNTLMSYQDLLPNDETKRLIDDLKKKWEIIIVSNNRHKRVKKVADYLELKAVWFSKKPLLGGMKKALAMSNFTSYQTISIGDQLTTDVQASKKLGLYTILVDAVSRRKEMLYTKIGRMNEKRILKKLRKLEQYVILEEYDRRHYGK